MQTGFCQQLFFLFVFDHVAVGDDMLFFHLDIHQRFLDIGRDLVPFIHIDQQRVTDLVESRADNVFGDLLPAPGPDGHQRPGITIDHAPFQGLIDITGSGFYRRGGKRIHEIDIHGRDADPQALQVLGSCHFFVEVKLKHDLTAESSQVGGV